MNETKSIEIEGTQIYVHAENYDIMNNLNVNN